MPGHRHPATRSISHSVGALKLSTGRARRVVKTESRALRCASSHHRPLDPLVGDKPDDRDDNVQGKSQP